MTLKTSLKVDHAFGCFYTFTLTSDLRVIYIHLRFITSCYDAYMANIYDYHGQIGACYDNFKS